MWASARMNRIATVSRNHCATNQKYPHLFLDNSGHQVCVSTLLRDVRAKIIVLDEGVPIPTHYGIPLPGESDERFDMQNKYDVSGQESIQDKINLATATLRRAKFKGGRISVNYLSGTGAPFGNTPDQIADVMNDAMWRTLHACDEQRYIGVFPMDFPGEWLVYRILRYNFQQPKNCISIHEESHEWTVAVDCNHEDFTAGDTGATVYFEFFSSGDRSRSEGKVAVDGVYWCPSSEEEWTINSRRDIKWVEVSIGGGDNQRDHFFDGRTSDFQGWRPEALLGS